MPWNSEGLQRAPGSWLEKPMPKGMGSKFAGKVPVSSSTETVERMVSSFDTVSVLRFLRFHTQTRHLGWFCFSLPVQTEPSFPSRFRVSLFLMGGQEGLLKSKPSGSVFLTSKIDGNENNQHNQHSYALVFHNYKSEMDFPNPRMKLRALQNTKQR